MKKQLYMYILMMSSFSACSKPKMEHSDKLIFKQELVTVIDSFLDENPERTACYELFINKTSPHESIIIIHSGNTSLVEEENKDYNQYSIMKVTYREVTFHIYSGAERYIQLEGQEKQAVSSRKEDMDRKVWYIEDSLGVYSVIRNVRNYPFVPLAVNFRPGFVHPPIILE